MMMWYTGDAWELGGAILITLVMMLLLPLVITL
jgi:hypothetical protein